MLSDFGHGIFEVKTFFILAFDAFTLAIGPVGMLQRNITLGFEVFRVLHFNLTHETSAICSFDVESHVSDFLNCGDECSRSRILTGGGVHLPYRHALLYPWGSKFTALVGLNTFT